MKWVFFFVVIFHVLIHLLISLKAFQIVENYQLTNQISKPVGVLWSLTFLVLAISAIQFILDKDIWWIAAVVGIILPQILIIFYWQDAKFGTILNIIILLATIITFADWRFNSNANDEIENLLAQNSVDKKETLTEDNINNFPPIVQKRNNRLSALLI